MTGRKPALSREFLQPSQVGEPVNRPFLGMGMIVVADMAGALVLQQHAPPRDLAVWVLGIAASLSAIGGAIYHAVRRFWAKGAIAGLTIGLVSLVATYFYVDWRFTLTDSIASPEFLLPLFVGALPGVGLYYAMMRSELVADDEVAAER